MFRKPPRTGPPLQALSLRGLSDNKVEVEFLTDVQPHPGSVEVLIVRYIGRYGEGCKGNGDARYMRAMACAGVQGWEPRAVVLDFSQLHYAFGDMLGIVFDINLRSSGAEMPMAAVTGPNSSEALGTLLTFELDIAESTDEIEWLFDDLSSALEYVRTRFE